MQQIGGGALNHTRVQIRGRGRRRGRGIGCSIQIVMGFWVTSLIFFLAGLIASLSLRLCYNRGPSANLLHLTLIITATICCWMMWAIVYLAQMKPLITPILNEGE